MTTKTGGVLHCFNTKARDPQLTNFLLDRRLSALRSIGRAPFPRQGVKPDVADYLIGRAFVREVMLPSPYPSHRGRPMPHLEITEAGRGALEPGPQKRPVTASDSCELQEQQAQHHDGDDRDDRLDRRGHRNECGEQIPDAAENGQGDDEAIEVHGGGTRPADAGSWNRKTASCV